MFSVVIPLYNKAPIIERTLRSVLGQTFTDYEVIIVDDGSTDNGVEVIRKFINDPRILIFSQENQGVSVARNRGIKESKFDYIAFLDGDDEWKPDFLLKINEAILKFPNASMYGTSSLHTNFITKESNDSTISKFRNKIVEVDCFRTANSLPHTSAIVVKKASLYNLDKELNVFPNGMKVCEDWACFHRIAITDHLIYIGIPLGIRNNNVEGQITGREEITDKELFYFWLDGVRYYNLLYNYWLNNNVNNKYFISYIKYNLRHNFKIFIKTKKWEVIDLMVSNLDSGIFCSFERRLYKNHKETTISIIYINLTKIYAKITNFFKVTF